MPPYVRGAAMAGALALLGACTGGGDSGQAEALMAPPDPPRITDVSLRRGGDTVYASMVAPRAETTLISSEPQLLSGQGTHSAQAEAPLHFARDPRTHVVRFTARNAGGEVTEERSLTVEADAPPTVAVEGLEGLLAGVRGTLRIELEDDVGLQGTLRVRWDNELGTDSLVVAVQGEAAEILVPVTPRRPGPLRLAVTVTDRVGPVETRWEGEVLEASCGSGPDSSGAGTPGSLQPDPLELELAEPVRLSRYQAACMRLLPGSYALAYYDASYVEPGTWQPDWRPHAPLPPFFVTVGHAGVKAGVQGVSAPSPAPGPAPAGDAPAVHHEPLAEVGAFGWLGTDSAWVPGDTLPYNARTGERGVVVLDILHDFFVLAYPVGRPILQSVQSRFDPLLERLKEEELSRLQSLFGVSPAAPNGQYLVVLVVTDDGVGISGLAGRGFMEVTLGTGRFHPALLTDTYRTLVHEFVHSVDLRARDRLQEELGPALGWGIWHVEGVADHLAYRTHAEELGLPLGQDLPRRGDWGNLRAIMDGGRHLEAGYHHAAAFAWYLTGRIAQASGLSWEEAHDEVTLALWRGRWGCLTDGDCHRQEGLYDLARRHLGEGWDPVEGTLTYILSQGLDNWTSNPALQNLLVNRARFGPSYSFHSDRPEALRLSEAAGGGAYVTLEVSEEAYFSAVSPLEEDVGWMLVRYR